MLLFGDRWCHVCDCSIPEDSSFFTHLSQNHVTSSDNLLPNLSSQNSDSNTNSFHWMKSVVSVCHSFPSLSWCVYMSLCLHCPFIGGKVYEVWTFEQCTIWLLIKTIHITNHEKIPRSFHLTVHFGIVDPSHLKKPVCVHEKQVNIYSMARYGLVPMCQLGVK